MARSHFSFEKRRKELDKQKKKEAKRAAKAERKAAIEAGEEVPQPIITVDEFGNVTETYPEIVASEESTDEESADEETDPA
ncbi:MAG: S-adenosylmethionine hydrolase [Candidatus Krumholzibacteriia bacterium]